MSLAATTCDHSNKMQIYFVWKEGKPREKTYACCLAVLGYDKNNTKK